MSRNVTDNIRLKTPLEYAKRLKAMADTGLVYAKDEYEKERYEELLQISLEMMGQESNQSVSELTDFFMPTKDYPTPKVDVRGLVLNDEQKVLMVKEKADGKWSLPGGWGEIGFTASEVIEKEIKEETGLDAQAKRLLAVYDKKCHPHPPQPFYVYKMIFLCEVSGGKLTDAFDIEEAGFFAVDSLPEISTDRILREQIERLHVKVKSDDVMTDFD